MNEAGCEDVMQKKKNSKPARFHSLEQSNFSPCAPLLLAVPSLLVFCCIEPPILLLTMNGHPNIRFQCGLKTLATWLERRKTEANPPEPSFFTILYSSFTWPGQKGNLPNSSFTLLKAIQQDCLPFLSKTFSSFFTSVMGLASTSPGGGGIMLLFN